jgi:hypothetical protein
LVFGDTPLCTGQMNFQYIGSNYYSISKRSQTLGKVSHHSGPLMQNAQKDLLDIWR